MLKLFEYAPQREALLKSLAAAATPDSVLEHLRGLFTLHDFDVYFGTLKNPHVFEVLKRAGAFALGDSELNYWPQASYLQSIAEAQSANVSTLLTSLKETTPGVTRQLLLVALALNDEAFGKVMRKAKWVRDRPDIAFLDPVTNALSRLGSLGEESVLFGIAKHLFDVDLEPERPGLYPFDRPQAVPVIVSSPFESVLDSVPGILARVFPVRTLKFLMAILDHVITEEGFDEYDHHGFWFQDFLDESTARYDIKEQLLNGDQRTQSACGRRRLDEARKYHG